MLSVNDSASHLQWITCCKAAQLNIQFWQGSVATDFRWGGRSNTTLFCSSSANTTVKEVLKSVHICESFEDNMRAPIFETRCTTVHAKNAVCGTRYDASWLPYRLERINYCQCHITGVARILCWGGPENRGAEFETPKASGGEGNGEGIPGVEPRLKTDFGAFWAWKKNESGDDKFDIWFVIIIAHI